MFEMLSVFLQLSPEGFLLRCCT